MHCTGTVLLLTGLAACSGETSASKTSTTTTQGAGGSSTTSAGGSSTTGVGGSSTTGVGGSSTTGVGGSSTTSAGGSSTTNGTGGSLLGSGGGAGSIGEGGAGGSVATGGSSGESTDGGTPPTNAQCMSFCGSSSITCSGPDTEVASTSSITATTATGCSLSIVLPFSGTVELDLDCSLGEVGEACVAQGGGCLGSPGECYTLDMGDTGFSYFVQGCLNGSLACTSS